MNIYKNNKKEPINSTLSNKERLNAKYTIQFFIEKNSYCEKYRVKSNNGKILLLKLYDCLKLSPYDFVNKNLLEVEILTSLIHIDNIIKLVDSDIFIKDGHKYYYIVLDFIKGETLKDRFQRKGIFPQYMAVSIVIQLLEILSKLHKKSPAIIHNNINLESVWLDYTKSEPDNLILSDFTFARYITSRSNSLNLDRLNPFYIAPEVYNGIYIPQSDIFSVGALLYNMVIGTPPWYIEILPNQYLEKEIIRMINDKRKDELLFEINGISGFNNEYLKNAIKKALSINIDNRFKNTEEFIIALKNETIIDNTKKNKIIKTRKKSKIGFSAVAGMEELKDILYNDVIRALKDPDLYRKYGITIPNGMLLYGPPGCGKTFIAEKFAEEIDSNFFKLKPSDINSKYINETEEKINKIFKEAEKKAPTVIFIDEIDAVAPNRNSNLSQMQASSVNELLSQMSNCSEKGIFLIAASNYPEKIDPALLRRGRIDRIFYVPPPDFKARLEMFKIYLEERPVDLNLNYEKLAEKTENFVSSDIKFLVDEASRIALKTKSRITQQIFDKVISCTKPSISKVEIKKYEKLREKFENKNSNDNDQKRPIGFVR